MRILLTEGSSTSAREAITALALAGHEVSYCDPQPVCLARFSRLVSRRYRCPPLGTEPEAFRDFVLELVANERFDVLLPIHEQGYLLARIADEIDPHVGLALPSFASYARVQAKVEFGGLLDELSLPQPRTIRIESRSDLRLLRDYPFVLKRALGTASRGTWTVRGREEHDLACAAIADAAGPDEIVLRQDFVHAPLEQAQAVFQHGRLVGLHAARRLIEGAGGGAALKESVARPSVAQELARLGAHLAWHGALSVDYFWDAGTGRALYIDGNPRLVEPMGAAFAGLDLAGMLVRVSLGEPIEGTATSRPGVRTRLALQALMGTALRQPTRRAILRTSRDILRGCNGFENTREELNPVREDPASLLPVVGAALALLARPSKAEALAARGWGAHLLTPEAAQTIRAMR